MPLLSLQDLTVHAGTTRLVGPLSCTLDRGERRSLLGPSGSGKSLTAAAVLGLVPSALRVGGRVQLDGTDVSPLPLARRPVSPRVAFIAQDPTAALNPQTTIGAHLEAALRTAPATDAAPGPRRDGAVELLEQLGFEDPASVMRRRPFQLSGGQRQRICLGIAIARRPDLLVADEPTTALDAVTQREVLALVDRMLPEDSALLFITHDRSAADAVRATPWHMASGMLRKDADAEDPAAELLDSMRVDGSEMRVDGSGTDHDGATAGRAAAQGEQEPPRARGTATAAAEQAREVGLRLDRAGVVHRSRRLGTHRALENVDLRIGPGERVGLVGASGSGKTTILRSLLGLQELATGEARFDGSPVRGRHGEDLRHLRRAVQVVPQDARGSLNPRATALGQVLEPLRFLGSPADGDDPAAHRDRAQALLTRVGLPEDRWRARPAELSGGQCQRVAVARALACRPEVILADEPMSGLDAAVRERVEETLRTALTGGVGLLLISHDLASVMRLVDRVVVLDGGRIVEDCPVGELLAPGRSPQLSRLLDAHCLRPASAASADHDARLLVSDAR